MDKIIPLCSKDTSLGMVFCFYNCSDPLWGKSVLVIENFWKIVRNHVKLGVSPRILYCVVDTAYGLVADLLGIADLH